MSEESKKRRKTRTSFIKEFQNEKSYYFYHFFSLIIGLSFGIDVQPSSGPAAVTSISDSTIRSNQFKIAGVIFEFGKSRQDSDFEKLTDPSILSQFEEWKSLFQNGNAIIIQRIDSPVPIIVLQYNKDGFLVDLQAAALPLSELVKVQFLLPKVKGTVNYNAPSYTFEDRATFLTIQYSHYDLSNTTDQAVLKMQFGYKL